jgi:hypothetical protein
MPLRTSGVISEDANYKPIPSGVPVSVAGNQTKQSIFTGSGIVGSVIVGRDVTDATCSLYDNSNTVLLNSESKKIKIDALGSFHGGIMGIEFPNGLKITTENFADGNLIVIYKT